MNENLKVLTVVDEALKQYGINVLSVDLNDDNMIDINICGQHWSDSFMNNVAHYEKCNIVELEKELDNRNVGHCW